MSANRHIASRLVLASLMASAALLAACGGGGGGGGGGTDSGQPAVATSFPLQAGISKLYAAGFQKNFSISGTATNLSSGAKFPVTGTATITLSPAGTSTFNGQSALVATATINGSVTVNGQSLPVAATDTAYLSTSYAPLGLSSPTATCVAQAPGIYPPSVTVGQTGTVVVYSCSTNSSTPTLLGNNTISFVTSPGTSSTSATFTEIGTLTNAAGQSVGSTQSVFSIDTSGNMVLLSETQLLTVNGIQMNLTLTGQ